MSAPGKAAGALVCPNCARVYPAGKRFCNDCRLPLVLDSRVRSLDEVSERHQRARKIKPQLAEGKLVRITGARNQAEAEFIQGLLLEEGVPSMLKRSAGFDVPDFLAAGPRDVLVPQAGVQTAREVLLQADLLGEQPGRVVAPVRLLLALVVTLVGGVALVWLVAQALH
ncbi:MAG: hypothetical protein JOZ73_14310 [Solirubrobacterales bacterium]|nr:hypothetical protein [Solirubrobacterales bacterium]